MKLFESMTSTTRKTVSASSYTSCGEYIYSGNHEYNKDGYCQGMRQIVYICVGWRDCKGSY